MSDSALRMWNNCGRLSEMGGEPAALVELSNLTAWVEFHVRLTM